VTRPAPSAAGFAAAPALLLGVQFAAVPAVTLLLVFFEERRSELGIRHPRLAQAHAAVLALRCRFSRSELREAEQRRAPEWHRAETEDEDEEDGEDMDEETDGSSDDGDGGEALAPPPVLDAAAGGETEVDRLLQNHACLV